MCILPNFEAADLEELRRRKRVKKAEDEKVEVFIPEQLLENPT
jgi:hypothetical protein